MKKREKTADFCDIFADYNQFKKKIQQKSNHESYHDIAVFFQEKRY